MNAVMRVGSDSIFLVRDGITLGTTKVRELRCLWKSEKLYPIYTVDFTGCAFRSSHFVEKMNRNLCAGGDFGNRKIAETSIFHSDLITLHQDADEILPLGAVCRSKSNFSRGIIRRGNRTSAALAFFRQKLNQGNQVEPAFRIPRAASRLLLKTLKGAADPRSSEVWFGM
jgi:hypothetical protein